MQTLAPILPLIILFLYYVAFAVLHTAFIIISADKIGRMRVRWGDAFRFAMGIAAITLIIRSLALKAGLPMTMGVVIGLSLALNVSLGAWYFGRFALSQQNEPVGWKGGLFISALAYVFLLLLAFIAYVVTK